MQKKIAIINDIPGYGRCAVTVALPIISTLKIRCCPIPTSIFSNHTAFPNYYLDDYTEKMQPYINKWKKLGLKFEGMETGFLGSKEQVNIVVGFLGDFRKEETVVVVDPIVGDHGETYATYTKSMCEEMKRLVSYVDVITPNVTETYILTDTAYHEEKWKIEDIETLAEQLGQIGSEEVVITGVPQGECIANYCYERDGGAKFLRTLKVGTQRYDTGDILAAIIITDAINGVPFQKSVKKASSFIKKCIQKSIEIKIPLTNGACFEGLLGTLQ